MKSFLSSGIIAILLLLGPLATAQEQVEDNTFGGWEFFEINHNFGKSPIFGSLYFEHDNFQYQRLDCWYIRTTVGVKILPWLSADVAYDFLRDPSAFSHRAVFDLTGSLKEGHVSVSLRERYMHTWTPSKGEQSDVLRSRLKVQYNFDNSRFSPYVAVELFTWGVTYKKCRYYAGCYYNFSKKVQAEAYYIYYAFNGKPAEHVLGIGLNFYL